MRWTRRQLFGLGALVVSGGALTACAETVTGSPRAPRTARPTSSRRPAPTRIRVAYVEGDQHALDVARAVLDKLGIEQVEAIKTKFEVMLPTMASQRADMAAGLYPNAQNCGKLLWSRPEHRALTALGVPAGNPKGLTTLADVQAKGATVSVMRDLPEHKYLTRIGIPAKQVQAFAGPVQMLDAVTNGQADCTAFNDVGLRSMIRADLAKLDVTTGFVLDGEPPLGGAFAFQPDGPAKDLLRRFDTELRKLHTSGEWLKIVEPYGFTKENLPPADLTAEKLCAG
ncbi:transporter substrate-binding domain-containing protein [Actinophytocola sp.]|uniref:transporter substrate-binding domain-containing protein n=1 Tax=Actinophytocola sp. TaxID=1872138 RepID=UPI002D7FC11D|nr:transporter substrate-binding domain-containing protein [Actinophytocola sp.]HET9142643.1 transporter substrate-binding domain-containing protein [Actinophytocola sp.]